MKAIAMTAIAMSLATSAWAGEKVPTATQMAGAGTMVVHLSESQMDSITAGNRFQDLLSALISLPSAQRSGFDLQFSLFGGPIFVAPPGCGGFFPEFGC